MDYKKNYYKYKFKYLNLKNKQIGAGPFDYLKNMMGFKPTLTIEEEKKQIELVKTNIINNIKKYILFLLIKPQLDSFESILKLYEHEYEYNKNKNKITYLIRFYFINNEINIEIDFSIYEGKFPSILSKIINLGNTKFERLNEYSEEQFNTALSNSVNVLTEWDTILQEILNKLIDTILRNDDVEMVPINKTYLDICYSINETMETINEKRITIT